MSGIITSLIVLVTLFIGTVPAAGNAVGESMTGHITCLPKKGPGPHTMECATGLKGSDGRYYAFKNLVEHDPEHKLSGGGALVEVSGTILGPEEMEGPAASTYDIAGVIAITSIRVLAE